MFTGIEAQVRAFGRLLLLGAVVLVLIVAALVGAAHHKAAPAPCPALQCGPCKACATPSPRPTVAP